MTRLLVFLLIVAYLSYNLGNLRNDHGKITYCTNNSDFLFVVDGSGSIRPSNFKLIKQFLNKSLEKLNGYGVHFGILLFSTNVEIVRSMSLIDNISHVHQNINSIKQLNGQTNISKGLTTAKEMIEMSSDAYPQRKNYTKVVILVSDGQSSSHEDFYEDAANDLKAIQGVVIVAVGVPPMATGYSSYNVMKSISSTNEVLPILESELSLLLTVSDICRNIIIYEGDHCSVFQKEIHAFCGVFKCSKKESGGFSWQRYWHGCPLYFKCFDWEIDMPGPYPCTEYKCTKPEGCDDDTCFRYVVAEDSTGCY